MTARSARRKGNRNSAVSFRSRTIMRYARGSLVRRGHGGGRWVGVNTAVPAFRLAACRGPENSEARRETPGRAEGTGAGSAGFTISVGDVGANPVLATRNTGRRPRGVVGSRIGRAVFFVSERRRIMARAVAARHLGRAGLASIQAGGIRGPFRHANPARASASRRVSGLVIRISGSIGESGGTWSRG